MNIPIKSYFTEFSEILIFKPSSSAQIRVQTQHGLWSTSLKVIWSGPATLQTFVHGSSSFKT